MSDTSKAPELLPCPFCGGEATTWITEAYSADSADVVLGCRSCDIYTPFANIFENYCLSEGVTREWNTRTDTIPAQLAEARNVALREVAEVVREMIPRIPHDGPRDQEEHTEYETSGRIYQTILALIDQPAPRVKVKPIDWFQSSKDGWYADTPAGEYSISYGELRTPASSMDSPKNAFENSDDAKAAAQQDYERRIISALEGQTDEH